MDQPFCIVQTRSRQTLKKKKKSQS
jgi:hypothetical protein